MLNEKKYEEEEKPKCSGRTGHEPDARPSNENTGQDLNHITPLSARLPSSFYDPS